MGDLVSIKSKTLSLKIKEIFLAELVYTPPLNSQQVSNEERFMKHSCSDFLSMWTVLVLLAEL